MAKRKQEAPVLRDSDAWLEGVIRQEEAAGGSRCEIDKRIASRILKTALHGPDHDALMALCVIEDYAGSGPVERRVEFV